MHPPGGFQTMLAVSRPFILYRIDHKRIHLPAASTGRAFPLFQAVLRPGSPARVRGLSHPSIRCQVSPHLT